MVSETMVSLIGYRGENYAGQSGIGVNGAIRTPVQVSTLSPFDIDQIFVEQSTVWVLKKSYEYENKMLSNTSFSDVVIIE
jgi:hypothetical protein